MKAREQDRALFDFDEDINELEHVEETQPATAKVTVPEEKQEEAKPKSKVPLKYQVKQAVRPAMPAHV